MTTKLELKYQKLIQQATKSAPTKARPVQAIRADKGEAEMTPVQLNDLIEGVMADYKADPNQHGMDDIAKQQEKNKKALDELKKTWKEILTAQIAVRKEHLKILDKTVMNAPARAHDHNVMQGYGKALQELSSEIASLETYLNNLERVGSVY